VVVVAVAEREALVQQYKQGFQAVKDALAGATDTDLDREADGWTARQVVHHLADSEMTSAIRLRRLLFEDRPLIHGYDEDGWSRRLWYSTRPIDAALDAFSAARRTTAEILDRMTEEDWAREGTHSESGAYGVVDWLRIYAAHAFDHAEQIRRALQG
jgi:hypothetical protein